MKHAGLRYDLNPFDRACVCVYEKLKQGEALRLHYHGIHHTRDDVLPAVIRLGTMAGLDAEDLFVLKTGALYHDVGCVDDYFNHEPASVAFAEATLPDFGYTPGQIERVRDIILATRLPQSPNNHLEELMCDADLDSLGRFDFFVTCHWLRMELIEYGRPASLREWYERELNFTVSHNYFTAVARQLRDAGKAQNVAQMRDLLRLD